MIYYSLSLWPYRLGVRTPGFHPGNRGSNPRRATTNSPKITSKL